MLEQVQAALRGSEQIGFTIISLTVSLIAVLIPLLFMGDVVGRLFREFAITLANLKSVASSRVIDDIKELRVASEYRNRMRIRCSDVYQTSGNLSGGNQQKVVLSKWLFTDPDILILDEPTRGIDIGAKYEIYCIINDLADAGKAVIMISSEMPELLGICDRICVMNGGAFVGEFDRAEATQAEIMRVIVRKGESLVDRHLEEKLQLEEKLLGEAHP